MQADDRAFVLVGALIIENGVDELLYSYVPGFKSIIDNWDFTFSLRIELARALRLVPARLLGGADAIRRVRNDFAHDLKIRSLQDLKSSRLESLTSHLSKFNPQWVEGTNHRLNFEQLVTLTALGLLLYSRHTQILNSFIRHEGLADLLQQFVHRGSSKDGE